MLSANFRATNALMNTRYPAQDHELTRAVKQSRLANSQQNPEIQTVHAVTTRRSRIRILLKRLGVAGT